MYINKYLLLAVAVIMLVGLTVIASGEEYNQAPMLAELVAAGELPDVAERLPVDPKVEGKPLIKAIGSYGGTYRYGITHEIGTFLWPEADMGEKQDVRPIVGGYLIKSTYSPEAYGGKTIVPELAKSWEWSDGGTVLTMHLREGVKWSDGESFTAEDVLFTFHDIIMHEEIAPASAGHFIQYIDGESTPVEIEKVDDFTIRFHLPQPDSTFLWKLAESPGMAILPKHKLIEDHPDYNENSSVGQLFRARGARSKPVSLGPWKVDKYLPGQQLGLTRNPYYWKVDEAGNQLPYIDKVIIRIYKSQETLMTDFMAGGLDTYGRFSVVNKFPTIKRREERGNYTVYLKEFMDGPGMLLNLGNPKEELKPYLWDTKFRKALSLSVERNVLGNLYAPGRFQPTVRSFSPASKYHDSANTPEPAYDPEEARKLLDQVGLKDLDNDGIREKETGEDFAIDIMVAPRGVTDLTQAVRKQWEEVGLKTTISTPERSSFISRLFAGEYDVWAGQGMGFPASPLMNSSWWVAPPPTADEESGEEEESTALFSLSNWKLSWNQEAFELIRQAKRSSSAEETKKLMAKAEDVISHAYPGIGLFWVRWSYGMSNRLGNHIEQITVLGTFPARYAEAFYVKQ